MTEGAMPEVSEVRTNIAQQMPTTQTGVETLAEARGTRRGEGVQVSSAASKVTEMAEEIGMSTAHRANKKDLGEKVQKRGAATDFDALTRVLRHMEEKLPDMPQEGKLKELVDTFRTFEEIMSGGGGEGQTVTKEDIIEALKNFDGDVTHQDVLLDAAIGYFGVVSTSEEFVETLKQAKEEFRKPEVVKAIQAGYVATEAATAASKSLGLDPAAMRAEFRSLLRDSPPLSTVFTRLQPLLETTPGTESLAAKLGTVVDELLSAIGTDLKLFETGTREKTAVGTMLTEMNALKGFRSAVEMMTSAYEDIARQRPKIMNTDDAPSLSKFIERGLQFISADQTTAFGLAQGLVRGFEDAGTDVPVLAANALRDAFSKVSDLVMPDKAEKGKAMFTLLDKLVAEEEAIFEGAG
ncbi:MAG: HrpJ domain-containing protein [Pseudomonadota bacterium]